MVLVDAEHGLPAPAKSAPTRTKLKTSHLQLVAGEEELFSTTKHINLYGCGLVRLEVGWSACTVAQTKAPALTGVS